MTKAQYLNDFSYHIAWKGEVISFVVSRWVFELCTAHICSISTIFNFHLLCHQQDNTIREKKKDYYSSG